MEHFEGFSSDCFNNELEMNKQYKNGLPTNLASHLPGVQMQ